MKTKILHRAGSITGNAMRQIMVSVFSMAVPFIVIHYSSKQTWGEFVSPLLFSLLALQIINWGNKEFLLRGFSLEPNTIPRAYSTNLLTRLPLVFAFGLIALLLFEWHFSVWIFVWLLGRFLNHSAEPLIIYDKAFQQSIAIEAFSFVAFCLVFAFYKNRADFFIVLVIYSLYQLLKGGAYFLLFSNYAYLGKAEIKPSYFAKAFPFLLLSLLGFLASKIDVYLIERLGNKIWTSDYQIINSLLVFLMSVSAFLYAPFTKNIYRSGPALTETTKHFLAAAGLLIIPIGLVAMHFLLSAYLRIRVAPLFYGIAFLYVFPTYLYGIDIVNLFRQRKERTVLLVLFIGVVINAILSSALLWMGYGMIGVFSGSAMAQMLVAGFFKFGFFGSANAFGPIGFNPLRSFRHYRNKKFYGGLVAKNQLCFDIGANIGAKSKLLLSLGAKVIAFEPQTSCFKVLNQMADAHPDFTFCPCAVGGKNETKTLHLANNSEVATLSEDFIDYFSGETVYWSQTEKVSVKSLDSLIEKYGRPDFCKIDTEGYELAILSALHHRLPLIEFEFTGGFTEDTVKIISLLDDGNTRFNYILNENLKFRLKDWVSAQEMILIFQTLPKARLHGNIFAKNDPK